MHKIIPFKKEMPFKSEVSEITSISLEHTLHKEKENLVTGIFTISGDYKVIDTSNIIDHFSFEIPFDIQIDDKYDLSAANIDIDDFYYEMINNKSLMIHIDVILDKIEEKEMARTEKEEAIEELEKVEKELLKTPKEIKIEKCEEEKIVPEKIEENHIEERNMESKVSAAEEVSNIFDTFENESTSSIYKVYMVKEEDSLESISAKYKIGKEELEKYNNIKEIKKGDKFIIPTVESEKI